MFTECLLFAFCCLQWGCRRVERVCVPYICTTFRMSIRKRGVSAGHNVGPLMSRHMSPTGQGKTSCSHACSCVQDTRRLHVFSMSRNASNETRNEAYPGAVDGDQNRSMAQQKVLCPSLPDADCIAECISLILHFSLRFTSIILSCSMCGVM